MRYLGVKGVKVWTCMQEQCQTHREQDHLGVKDAKVTKGVIGVSMQACDRGQ